MKLNKIMILLFCISISHEEKIDIDFMEAIVEEFEMKHPRIVTEVILTNPRLLKRLFKIGHYSTIAFNLSSLANVNVPPTDIIIQGSNNNDNYSELLMSQKSVGKVMIIPNDEEFLKVKNSLHVNIDQQVFLLDQDTREVFEIYDIEDHHVETKLGTFSKLSHIFTWEKDVNKDFLERRSNFHGIMFKTMTETTGTSTILDSSYKDKAKYFPNNETYLVNEFVSGYFYDVLMELKNQLNFTTSIFKNKEISWGFVYPQPNGSFVATGMVGDLFFKRADLVMAPLTLIPKRAKYIDYLLPIQPLNLGLYIPSGSSRGNFDFDMLLSPFR